VSAGIDAAILLVEDDDNDVAVALRAFRRAELGDAVQVVRDGQAALEVLGLDHRGEPDGDAGHEGPEVIFLDLKMPRVDGWEVLRRLREADHTRHIPVVAISSSGRDGDIRDCYELGANSFIVKHFEPRKPGAYLVEAARYWLHLNRAPQGDGE